MKYFKLSLVFAMICMVSSAQNTEKLPVQTKYVSKGVSDSLVKVFSNSESQGVTFLVSTDLKEEMLFIRTNYPGRYNIRFIDFWGRNSIDFKDVTSDIVISLETFERSIFVMNISDERNKNLISSQIINLKKHLY
jgi:hypothetical protein